MFRVLLIAVVMGLGALALTEAANSLQKAKGERYNSIEKQLSAPSAKKADWNF